MKVKKNYLLIRGGRSQICPCDFNSQEISGQRIVSRKSKLVQNGWKKAFGIEEVKACKVMQDL